MKKLVILPLLIILVFMGCERVEKQEERNDKSIISESGISLEQFDDSLICTITYSNGTKLEKVNYPFQSEIAADHNVQSDLILFEDFTIELLIENEVILMNFHDGHFITIDDVTISVSELPFNSSLELSKESKEAILTGKDIPIGIFLMNDISSIEADIFINSTRSSHLTLKTDEARDLFVDKVKNVTMSGYTHPEDVMGCVYHLASGQEIDPVTVTITDKLGNTLVLKDECGTSFNVNGVEMLDPQDAIIDYFISLIKDELFYYYPKFYPDYKVYLRPTEFENKDFSINSTVMEKVSACSTEIDEQLINFKALGLTAYENGVEIDDLPLDNYHFIDFVDTKGNTYQTCYR